MGTRLEGRIAIVTGGSRGIGAAIAEGMLREGARVVIASRKQEGLDEAVARIGASENLTALPLHVGKLETIAAFVEEVNARVGVPDILVNNAGTNPYFGPMMGLDWAAWQKTFQVNLEGPFELTRQVALRLTDAKKSGSVINIASILGMQGAQMQGIYAMTKASLISLTQTLAIELAPAKIRVNAIAPGFVETRLAAALVTNPAIRDPLLLRTPAGRIGQPEEIAGLAVYLAGNESSFTTGQTFVVDGGYTIG